MAVTLKELQQIGVVAQPTVGHGVALDLTGRVPVSVLPREITGSVTGAGAVTAGTGFTVNRTGAGRYVITFTLAFTAAPVVVVSVVAATGNETLTVNASTTTAFQVNTNDAGAAVDRAFYFIAAEVR